MKSFDEFKTIAYKNSIPHTVYSQGKSKKIPQGQAVPVRSRSSARGGHGGGHGGHGGGHGGHGGAGASGAADGGNGSGGNGGGGNGNGD